MQTEVTQDTILHIIEIIITTIDKEDIASRESNGNDRYRQRSNSNNNRYQANNYNRDSRKNSSDREQYNRYNSRDRNNDRNKNHNKNRIKNIEQQTNNDDPPGIDKNEYTSESSNEDQEILDKFYNANEDTCNTIINTLESNPTWILPSYQ